MFHPISYNNTVVMVCPFYSYLMPTVYEHMLSLQDCFRLGNILELQSKVSGDRLMLDSDGLLNCNGDGGPACKLFLILHTTFPYILHTTGQFKVRSSGRPGVYKLQSVAQPRCYLGYSKGYIIGHVS